MPRYLLDERKIQNPFYESLQPITYRYVTMEPQYHPYLSGNQFEAPEAPTPTNEELHQQVKKQIAAARLARRASGRTSMADVYAKQSEALRRVFAGTSSSARTPGLLRTRKAKSS